MAKRFTEINWGPLATNILGYLDNPNLTLPDGRPVQLTQEGMKFKIVIPSVNREGNPITHEWKLVDNVSASGVLNTHQVGIQTEA